MNNEFIIIRIPDDLVYYVDRKDDMFTPYLKVTVIMWLKENNIDYDLFRGNDTDINYFNRDSDEPVSFLSYSIFLKFVNDEDVIAFKLKWL